MHASKNSLNLDTGFMRNCYPTTNEKNNRCKNCAFPVKIMLDFRTNVQNHALHYPNPNAITPNR